MWGHDVDAGWMWIAGLGTGLAVYPYVAAACRWLGRALRTLP